ncbi:glycosyltransferase family 2 protein [Streptomyces sp. NPDC056987]|uniref:glycosyltransferase family 2 protein n=1 Tax=Streptomyces sp. NPDC056987 TaxID=3345988 RepID=UPI0036300BEC
MDVSIVVNTRDRPDRLRLLLSSLQQQRNLPGAMEVVVVDDGSQTDLAPALEEHRGLDVRLVRQPPLGYTVARNAGLRAAAGEVILCLDDDVLFDEELVATHLSTHLDTPSAIVVGDRFNTYLSNLDTRENRARLNAALRGDWGPLNRRSRRDYYAAQTLKLFDRHPHALPAPWLCFVNRNVSFRRADALDLGGYDEGFVRWGVDDIELGLRMHHAGAHYHYRAEARVYHLETPLPPGKLDALRVSLTYFAEKHRGVEPAAFRSFVFGKLSLEELCASVQERRLVSFEQRMGLTFFHTRR